MKFNTPSFHIIRTQSSTFHHHHDNHVLIMSLVDMLGEPHHTSTNIKNGHNVLQEHVSEDRQATASLRHTNHAVLDSSSVAGEPTVRQNEIRRADVEDGASDLDA